MKLAVDSYRGLALADGPGRLDLSWTSDERDALEPELSQALAPVLADAARHIAIYPVGDPYGRARLSPAVARRFALGEDVDLVCGAGVGALVAATARAFATRRVAVLGSVYPDLPAWLARLGTAPVDPVDPVAGTLGPARADVVFLEHPSLRASADAPDPAAIVDLCRRGFEAVVVDESNANYMQAAESALGIAPMPPNLVVLRGLSKAYGMGGLRCGYAAGGRDAVARIAAALPPLQVSSLSLAAAEAILALPDAVEARLRDAIAQARRAACDALAAAGFPAPIASHPALPYLLYDPDADPLHRDAVARLARLGIHGKRHLVHDGATGALARFSAPMRADRRARLAALLGGGAP
ncbi:aminotransferase class I/II-fold pyridoxal phosphate-dependent enzyme [Salinarimonas sp.]|uniref:aminotransferase class I/II-fold pyridoxal phosphate-dependent enzyme n=1 Tax=Salinarimonas sp. TaxID=2766526 RepID=UPI0032D8F6C4